MGQLQIARIQQNTGVSDAELARRIKTNQTQLSRLLKGERRITLDWLRRIARALDCAVSDLLSEEDYPDRLSSADKQLIARIREADAEPEELLDLLAAIEKMVKRQAQKRAQRSELPGDPTLNGQLTDIWLNLDAAQQRHMLNMMEAAAQMTAHRREAAA